MVQTGGAPNKERLDGISSAGKRLRRIFSNSFSFPFVKSIISRIHMYGKFLPNFLVVDIKRCFYLIFMYVSATLLGKFPSVNVSPAVFCQVPDNP